MAVSATKIHLSGLARKLVLDALIDEASAADHYQKALAMTVKAFHKYESLLFISHQR